MTTSGTVGQTVIPTSTLLDHALLRVGKSPVEQTPQIVQQCQEALFMLLLSLSNRGLNLWCTDRILVGTAVGQPTYQMTSGVLDVMNVIYSQNTMDLATGTPILNGMSLVPTQAVTRIGIQFGTPYTGTLNISVLPTITPSASYAAGVWYWFDLPSATVGAIDVVGVLPDITVLQGATAVRDLPMTPLNRDTFMALPNKAQQSSVPVNFFFEKKIPVQLTLWPVPNTDINALALVVHRQVQDVGTLPQTIEVPSRWLEAITWQLALRMAFELPGVAPDRIQLVNSMAGQYLMEDELGEEDGMPSSLQPNIRAYTA